MDCNKLVDRVVYLPAHDKHFKMFTWYQHSVYKAATSYCTNFRTAIDIGAHVGYFSMYMAHDFARVIAFEPITINADCWVKNLENDTNAELLQCAVGNDTKPLRMVIPCHINSGSWMVDENGTEIVEQVRLDDFQFNDVDYIKIDVQGHEYQVLQGAVETLKLHKPIVQVEMTTEESVKQAGGLLCDMGFAPVEQRKEDVIWKFTDEYNVPYEITLHPNNVETLLRSDGTLVQRYI